MLELIKTDYNLCQGCNSCIRTCPVEEANIAYCDENGNIKVKINANKCIHCGACIKACTHNARHYEDDTDKFFKNLKGGEQLSLIVAPAFRLNYKNESEKILGKLKSMGIQKIYDVSLGADICTWAHIRYMQKHKNSKVISQPCPAIVNYILLHQPDLMNFLSPIHSPMMCTAIYMQKYQNIKNKIVALSPCIAKADEFNDCSMIQYNVTYNNLSKYISDNKLPLDASWGGFDNINSSLGAIFSMPGGLKENVEFYLGDKLQIAKSEGPAVYEMLDEYAASSTNCLPDLFDVLNCEYGCNFGTGCANKNTLFDVNSRMFNIKHDAIVRNKKTILSRMTKLFKLFDRILKIDDFIRTYNVESIPKIRVTETDIDAAFERLGKKTTEQKKHNCHACGLTTCRDMAINIAKGINIPENCIEKNRQSAVDGKKHVTELLLTNKKSSLELTNLLSNVTSDIKSIDKSVSEISLGSNNTANDLCKIVSEISELQELSNQVINALKSIDDGVNEYHTMGKFVADIAMQTKILAINASIEASHAGSYGNSFAVIASEIRSLAQKTSESVVNALDAREISDSAIANIKTITSKLDEALNSIGNYTCQVSAAAEEISAQTQEISKTTKNIYSDTENINDLAKTLNS